MTKRLRLIREDAYDVMSVLGQYDMVFADPPDNIGLKYHDFVDKMPDDKYITSFRRFLFEAARHAPIVWVSFNAKWLLPFANIFHHFPKREWEFKPCVQTFTFGQHNSLDLGNCHRPLWRLKRRDAGLYPGHILIESERQKMGDKRANPLGKVPGDVFDFPRVTGNSKQRRKWHPTQLNEGLVERCVLLSTPMGGSVLDPFAGTGTTLRVCERIGRSCDSIELDHDYCDAIATDMDMIHNHPGQWEKHA